MKRFIPPMDGVLLFSLFLGAGSAAAQTPSATFANFEASQTNPIRLSADGTRLFVVNTPNGTLSVFNVTQPATPTLIAEIPVGVEPVSVNPRTDNEAWVVNEVSGSVSVVSVSQGIVTDTIHVGQEPHDVVFAGSLAYVSVSRNNAISAFNVTTHALVSVIAVFGGSPRALAVSPDGSKVYAAMAISGNATTLIPTGLAPPQSPPTNPNLPTPPPVGLIVQATDPNWSSVVNYSMPDYDVAIIGTGSQPSLLGYYSGVGTINLGMAVNPTTGDIFVSNTNALNLIHFETNLQGHFVNNQITRIQVSTGQVSPFDLNPGINYSLLPNPQALITALAQPAAVVFSPNGKSMWVAAFGTDRVAQVDTNGNVLSRIEIAAASGAGSNVDPKNKKGPRGLALNSTAHTLYVSNRISNTISVVNTNSQTVLSEIAIGFDPTPAAIHAGRGFLYDAKLSGNGTGSCASCHVDGDMDHLAWDLGDPGGTITGTLQQGTLILFHPMKGPMTTQTLKGLLNLSPYHWRGDHQNFAAFNSAFNTLLGGSQLATADMTIYTDFVNSILFQPNPYQTLSRGFPTTVLGGNPTAGQSDFINLALTQTSSTSTPQTCNSCHEVSPSGPGTNRLINPTTGSGQPMKNPQLRNEYQKDLRQPVATASGGLAVIDGFGMDHDGDVADFTTFFEGKLFNAYTATEKLDMAAYLICFDTGTAPAVGYTRTLTKSTLASGLSDWNTLQAQASAGNIDLVVRGTVSGVVHGLLYKPASNNYQLDTGTTVTQAQLELLIKDGDVMSVMGVYPGTGSAAVGTTL
jgi:YVTN family beta-propeller protein